MKTYVLVGERGYGDEYEKNLLYAGNDENLARQKAEDEKINYDFTIHVWCNGEIIKTMQSYGGGMWTTNYDIITNLESAIKNQEQQLKSDKIKLEELKEKIGE